MESRREPTVLPPAAPGPQYAVGIRGGAAGRAAGVAFGRNAFFLGFDFSYSPLRWSAFGLEAELAVADNGADPHYCVGCMRSGSSWRAFGEIRPFDDGYVFPFARLSAGLYDMEIIGKSRRWMGPAFGAAAGVEGRLRPVYLRVIAFATAQLGTETPARASNHLAGWALEVGAAF
jgi:hypothetical protein